MPLRVSLDEAVGVFFEPALHQVPGFVRFIQALAPHDRIAQDEQVELALARCVRSQRLQALPVNRRRQDEDDRRDSDERMLHEVRKGFHAEKSPPILTHALLRVTSNYSRGAVRRSLANSRGES